MSLADGARITIPDTVVHQQLGDEIVMLHLASGQYYGLDDVGSRLWVLLREHRSVGPVVAAMAAEYDVDESILRADVSRIVDELADAGLIQVEQGQDG